MAVAWGKLPEMTDISDSTWLRLSVKWAAIVLLCALPLIRATWDMLSLGEHLAVAGGVLAWALLMAVIDNRRCHRADGAASRRLVQAALAFGILQGALSIALDRVYFFAFYSPAVVAVSRVVRVSEVLSMVSVPDDVVVPLVLTLACGGQVLICVLIIARLTERWRLWSPVVS